MAARKPASAPPYTPVTSSGVSLGVLEVDSLKWRAVEWRFHAPLRLTRTREYGHIVFENADLTLYAYGTSEKAARKALARDFSALWHIIAEADDSELETMACGLKKRLREFVSEVRRKE